MIFNDYYHDNPPSSKHDGWTMENQEDKQIQTQCKYPDWEGGLTIGKHVLDKDGYCIICGDKPNV